MWYPSLMSQHLLPHLQLWSLLSSPYLPCWSFQPPSPCKFIPSLSTSHLPLVPSAHSISNFSLQFGASLFDCTCSPTPSTLVLSPSSLNSREDKFYLVHFFFSPHLTPLQDVPSSPETAPTPSRDLFLVKSHGHCSFLTLFYLSDLSNTNHVFIALFASGDSAFPNTLSGVFWRLAPWVKLTRKTSDIVSFHWSHTHTDQIYPVQLHMPT